MIGQRISAGGIVIQNNKVLLVHHYIPDSDNFWVLPGGGIDGDEGILKAAEREVFEETNLQVKAKRIAYIEEFIDMGKYVCKFWVYCETEGGQLSIANKEENEDYLKDARFFSQAEIQHIKVFPSILKDQFWQDAQDNFPNVKYLGYPEKAETS